MKLISLLTVLFMFTSCAGYVDRIHRELDREDEKVAQGRYRRGYDTFQQFRGGQNYEGYKPKYYRPTPNPINTVTSTSRTVIQPNIKRNYQPEQAAKKRYTASDLEDSKPEASLWAGSGNENYLFTKNKWKKNGDIVLVNVQTKLKKEITLELKRAFPVYPRPSTKKNTKEPASAPAQAEEEDETSQDDPAKVHDRISSVIIEEISKDHLLVRGQKLLLYKNRKRLIELQALVSRKDISDDDTINSSKFLESSITVIR